MVGMALRPLAQGLRPATRPLSHTALLPAGRLARPLKRRATQLAPRSQQQPQQEREPLSEAAPRAAAGATVLRAKQEGASTDLAVILPRLKTVSVGRGAAVCWWPWGWVTGGSAGPCKAPAECDAAACRTSAAGRKRHLFPCRPACRSWRCRIGRSLTRSGTARGGSWRACLPSRWARQASGAGIGDWLAAAICSSLAACRHSWQSRLVGCVDHIPPSLPPAACCSTSWGETFSTPCPPKTRCVGAAAGAAAGGQQCAAPPRLLRALAREWAQWPASSC